MWLIELYWVLVVLSTEILLRWFILLEQECRNDVLLIATTFSQVPSLKTSLRLTILHCQIQLQEKLWEMSRNLSIMHGYHTPQVQNIVISPIWISHLVGNPTWIFVFWVDIETMYKPWLLINLKWLCQCYLRWIFYVYVQCCPQDSSHLNVKINIGQYLALLSIIM